MKRLIFLTILFSFIACNESASKKINSDVSQAQISEDRKYAEITFDRIFHDFGNINEGQIVKTFFTFTNTSQNDLYIVDARGSCGCTVPTWRKADGSATWQPGEDGTIGVKYATNRVGKFTKTITLSFDKQNTITGNKVFFLLLELINKDALAILLLQFC